MTIKVNNKDNKIKLPKTNISSIINTNKTELSKTNGVLKNEKMDNQNEAKDIFQNKEKRINNINGISILKYPDIYLLIKNIKKFLEVIMLLVNLKKLKINYYLLKILKIRIKLKIINFYSSLI